MQTIFGEKAFETVEGKIVSYGIPLESRYHKVNEFIKMLTFCSKLLEHNSLQFVTRIFYDSKSGICEILTNDAYPREEIERVLVPIGHECFVQFTIFDEIYTDDSKVDWDKAFDTHQHIRK